MKKTVLREYAKLIVRCGVNVQKGQEVIIYAGLDQPEFVQMVVEQAYKAKAKKVTVEWNYDPLTKLHVRYQSVKTMGTVTEWQKAKQQYFCDVLPARIHLVSDDPDGLKGVNIAKMAKAEWRDDLEGDLAVETIRLGSLNIPSSELADPAEEIKKLNAEKERLEKEIARSTGILSNPGFLNKAPAAKIELEKKKLDEYQKQYQTVTERLNKLS